MSHRTPTDRLGDFAYFSTHLDEYQANLRQGPNMADFFHSNSEIQSFLNFLSSRIYTINYTIFNKSNVTDEERNSDLTRLQMDYVRSHISDCNLFA